jgi:hypothetical protein
MAFSEQYDKAILWVGVLIGVAGLSYGAYSYMSLGDKYQTDTSIAEGKVDFPGVDASKQVVDYLTASHDVDRPSVGTQKFDIFVAPQLWLQSGKSEPIDIRSGPPIHGDIPNTWFLDNGLEDILKYSDALTRDPDEDGFNILEEYEAQTNPNDPNSHPSLLSKLQVVKCSASAIQLAFTQDQNPDYGFTLRDRNGNEIGRLKATVGSSLSAAQAPLNKIAKRFKLKEIKHEKRLNKSTNEEEETAIAIIEDQKDSKAGTLYEIQYGPKFPVPVVDLSAELKVLAGAKANQTFKVEEGKNFKIPGDDTVTFSVKEVNNKKGIVRISGNIGAGEKTWDLKK